jgi:hypothetical protein
MLLFRSLALGLIAACFWLQLDHNQAPAPVAPPPPPPAPVAATTTIIDVAAAVDARELPFLLHLHDDERITAVDDQRFTNTFEAGMAIIQHQHRFVDLTVESPESSRRVLMLLH